MSLPSWEDLVAGKGCPFCLPRPDENAFWLKIADLGISSLYLDKNQTFRGYSVLVFNPRHVLGLEQVSAEEFSAFAEDLRRAALAITAVVRPDHMNYATLGNVIPHLHYHIIPRHQDDPRWGAPVWTTRLEDMQKTCLPDNEHKNLAQEIRVKLQG